MPNTSISFPANPAVNQQYTYGTTTYVWTGTSWMTYIDSASLMPTNPAAMNRQLFSGTGAQTQFTLASNPGALGNGTNIYINGIYQQRNTYTVVGTTLTFSAAPPAGTNNIEVVNFVLSNVSTVDSSFVTYLPTGTGAVTRSASSKFGDTVSVKDFGAVGDGVADDTAAIQAAINALAANQYEKADGLFFPAGIYKITATLNVTLTQASLTLWADTKATLHADVPTGSYVIDVDYSSGATANFVTFNMHGIAISDVVAPLNVKHGIRLRRVLGSKFTQCEFNYLDIAVDMGQDTNLNTFDTCMWRANVTGVKSTSGVANNNTFVNCQWRYHTSTAFDSTGTAGNTIIAGNFEPDNANPVVIAHQMTMVNTRLERNIQGSIIQVHDNNDLAVDVHSDGGTQALPVFNVIGSNNSLKLIGGAAARVVTYGASSSNNSLNIAGRVKAMIGSPAGSSMWISGTDVNNVIMTPASIQSNTDGSLVECLQDNLVPADLTTWTATNCTVTAAGGGYQIVATGAGTASVSYTLVGTYDGLRMALTFRAVNASGQPIVALGVTGASLGGWPESVRKRTIVSQFDYAAAPVTNPVISITLTGTGVGAQCDVWNVRMASNGRIPN